MSANSENSRPWYAGKNQDVLFYLLIAILFIEFIVGGIAFFYGIMHAKPDVAGGPPIARFPWLYWALASILAPVGLLLIVHLTGSLLSASLKKGEEGEKGQGSEERDELPEGMRRFYAAVRHAPTVIVLISILLLGAVLFFMDGAFAFLKDLFIKLLPYIPWLAGSLAALLAVCFITHAIMLYRQRKMENEYAWRREVLEKTGLVLTDRNSLSLSVDSLQKSALPSSQNKAALPESGPVLDVKPNKADERAEKEAE